MRHLLFLIFALGHLGLASTCAETIDVGEDPRSQLAWLGSVLEPGLAGSATVPMTEEGRVFADFLEHRDSTNTATVPVAEAVVALERAYRRSLATASDGSSIGTSELIAWARGASDDIATYAILVTEPGRRDVVVSAAVYWKSPMASRIRVVDLRSDIAEEATPEEVLEQLGTCVVGVDEWIQAPEPAARRFLEEHVEAAMFVLAPAPESSGTIERWVPAERLVDALRFGDPSTADLDAFSAWFAGERPSAWAVTRLIPTLRSSLGPRDLFDLFRTAR